MRKKCWEATKGTRDDGTPKVHKWVSDIQWNSFHGLAIVCKEGKLENDFTKVDEESDCKKLAGRTCGRRNEKHVYKERHVEKHRLLETCC